jgi:aminotransferase
MREKTIVINGLSKSHAMTGWRIGFTFAPAYLTAHMVKVHQYNVTCASSISQYAAVEALTNGIDDAEPMKAAYVKRRDYVHGRLLAMGLPVEKPEGAFYLFPSIQSFGLKSMEFAMKLLEEERVAVVPGDAFSGYGEGYIRLSYAYSMDVLSQALDRMERFVQRIG